MFEKEAIIHAFEETIGIECLNKPVEDFTYEELSDELQEKAYDFKKGAEYGYKYKENEWHYIKNGDFPKNTKTVLALCIVGGEPYPYLAQYWKGSTTARKNGVDLNWNCWLNNMQREVVEPYAWREITIPEFGLQGDCNK